jgi:hypothetical protein
MWGNASKRETPQFLIQVGTIRHLRSVFANYTLAAEQPSPLKLHVSIYKILLRLAGATCGESYPKGADRSGPA